MTEENNPTVPEADRFSVEYIALAQGSKEELVASLQEHLNEGSRQSWRLLGVAPDPHNSGLIVVWDLEGFISG